MADKDLAALPLRCIQDPLVVREIEDLTRGPLVVHCLSV